jgi:hypothetical protein
VAHPADRMLDGMCRSIQRLHNVEPAATPDEVRSAALQFVRKISGSVQPSLKNQAAFDRAVEEVAAASLRLLDELVSAAPPQDRAVAAQRRRAARVAQLSRRAPA